jgi:D-glycero-D-manno-heptose 1,7-bisphosphate phosphatase
MLERAARRLGLDLPRSVMVGDRASDVGAGDSAGCWTVLLTGGPAPGDGAGADHMASSLLEATEWILALRGPKG